MVVDQVHVYRLAISEAKDDSPIPRDAHAPLSATTPFELVQPPAGQVQVPWRTCILQRAVSTRRMRSTWSAFRPLGSSRSWNLRSVLCANLMP